jgi:hypothetical protein
VVQRVIRRLRAASVSHTGTYSPPVQRNSHSSHGRRINYARSRKCVRRYATLGCGDGGEWGLADDAEFIRHERRKTHVSDEKGAGHCAAQVHTGARARAEWERIRVVRERLPISHLPEWLDCMCSSGRWVDATRAYHTADGRRLVLPLARRRVTPAGGGDYQSWPYLWDAGADNGGLISDGPVHVDDVRMVTNDLISIPAARIQVTPGAWDDGVWAAAALSRWRSILLSAHVVDLREGSHSSHIDGMSANFRKRLRKAERIFEIESDTTGRLMPVVDDLYRRAIEQRAREHWLPTAMARQLMIYRDPPEGRAELVRRFGQNYRVWVAWRDGQAVSVIAVLSAGPAATFAGGVTDKAAAGNSGVGQLLHTRALETARDEGRSRYDLGSSGAPSHVYFKESIGARPVAYHSYSFERLPITASQRTLRTVARTALTQVSRCRPSS